MRAHSASRRLGLINFWSPKRQFHEILHQRKYPAIRYIILRNQRSFLWSAVHTDVRMLHVTSAHSCGACCTHTRANVTRIYQRSFLWGTLYALTCEYHTETSCTTCPQPIPSLFPLGLREYSRNVERQNFNTQTVYTRNLYPLLMSKLHLSTINL